MTFESCILLEKALTITNDLHDIHSLGNKAILLHCFFMEDLSKANTIPFESLLSNDTYVMTYYKRERDQDKVSSIYGQVLLLGN